MQHLRKAWANLQKFREHNAILKMELDENRVVFIGDSIIAGWNAHPFFKENSHYINRGINGQTTSQILRRFKSDVIALQPKYVLILVGTNDIAENNGRISLEEIQKNFESMLAIAAANQLKVVLGSVLPVSSYYWNKNIIQPNLKIKALNQILSSYANRSNVFFLDFYTDLVDTNAMSIKYTSDGVHPNSDGYTLMTEILQKQNFLHF